MPIFGKIRTFHEARNIFDNFGSSGQLRDETIERYLSKKSAPCIVDCGVNVGVTARWWFHLNRRSTVFGIDMMKESQEFTVETIKSIGIAPDRYRPIIAALWSENGKEFKIGIGDPLCGDYGFYRFDKEKSERTFVTRTLDTVFDSENIGDVDLLKIDLEGVGGEVLKDAAKLLKKTKHIFLETHSEEESKLAGSILTSNKFRLRKTASRHQWWEKYDIQ
ncbi:MAG: FkbM family methyltransferase [Candidatus Omnitrophica bacterium]|nr:FkbM family methyltransferase [Candidatus Omnitrophota bacterium]